MAGSPIVAICVAVFLVLDPNHYKNFIDTVFMHGEYETYIDFLIAKGRLGRVSK
jgi:hypothetical protein